MKRFSAIGKWYSRLVTREDDTAEIILRKKFLLSTNLVALFFLSCITLISHYILDAKIFAAYMLLLVACTLIQTILLFVIRNWSRGFMYAYFSIYMVLIFYIIFKLGGIANSAGLLMAAYFFLLTAQWMQDTKLLLVTGILFVLGVLFVGLAFPYISENQVISGWKNNLFFAINFGWIGILIAVALYFSIVKSEKAAESRAEELEGLDILKSKLYNKIANEFRTPLTLIKGKAEAIGERHKGNTLNSAGSIIRNSNKILNLVNQMSNLSRIEEGGISLNYIQAEVIKFFRNIISSFQGFADSKNIGLHFQSQLPQLMMDMDSEKLEECLSNLLSNAIKYTPEGGDVFVELKLNDNPHKQLEIKIRDTGIGIPDDQLDKIFIRFYRVEDKRYSYQEGSGIGLTLVNEYLKLMKGSIEVNSRPGKGSEFILLLPVTQNAEFGDPVPLKRTEVYKKVVEIPLTAKKETGSSQPRLLIIEDNRELLEYLDNLLKNDYNILCAMDGIRGINQAIRYIPDIVLSDVMMPGKDGYQVCKALKNDIRTNHIPIVLLTARADTESRITGREQGADAYLSKPFDKKELMTCLQNLFVQREILRLKFQSSLCKQKTGKKEHGLNDKFLCRVIRLLEENYKNNAYKTNKLYSDLGISRVQLHRKLVALTGQSTSAFIRNFRLQKARKLLLKTNKNVSEIAYETGFADPNYFTRTFSKEFGMNPTEIRNSLA